MLSHLKIVMAATSITFSILVVMAIVAVMNRTVIAIIPVMAIIEVITALVIIFFYYNLYFSTFLPPPMTGCQLAGKETAITINGVHVGDRVKFQVQLFSSLVRLGARLILLKLVIYSADKRIALLGVFLRSVK